MKPRCPCAILAAACAAAAAGCVSHSGKLAQVKADLAFPNYAVNTNAAPFRARDVRSSDKILYLSERARAYQLTGDLDNSTEDYLAAEAAYDALDDRPVVSISAAAEVGMAGTVANDTILPYVGNAHERLMLYQLDAFNHLARHDWNGARAAANNVVYLSEKVRRRHEKEVRAAEEAAQRDGRFKFSSLMGNPEFRAGFAASDEVSKTFTDALQNGYAYYFGAFVREVDGDFSGALLGYRRAAEVAPANGFVQQDIARMEARLGAGGGGRGAPAEPNVVVFFEEGFAPELEPFVLSFATLPMGHHKGVGFVSDGKGGTTAVPLPTSMPLTVKFALPYYSSAQLGVPSYPLVIADGLGGVVAQTQLVGDFRALAARAFGERLPYVATRAAIRAIGKATAAAIASHAVKDKDDGTRLAVLMGGLLLTQATETADLRTWLLAPRFGQVARFQAAPGTHRMTFTHGGNSGTVDVDVPDAGPLVLHVISIPGRLVIESTAISSCQAPG